MYAIKGFVSHASFSDNTVGKVATIGEISTKSLTFSREKGQYTTSNAPDLTLTTFLSAVDGVLQPVPGLLVEHILKICKFVYGKTLNSTQQVYADELFNDLITTFAGEAENFSGGQIITDGKSYMPEWISWKYVKDSTYGNNEIRVWFVDDSFQSQYDEFQIVVVPPLVNLDDFFKTGTEVENAVNAVTETLRWQQVQSAKDGYPETIVSSIPYDYNDPYNASHKVPTNWAILMYGNAANNVDAVNRSVEDYILANSTHTRDEWIKIFPDIFKHTEFILVPVWWQYAVAQKETQEGLYSGVLNMTQAIGKLKEVVSTYPANQIEYFGSSMAHVYKGLAILSVGSIDNRDNLFRITDVFPDYFPVSTTSLDFNRMSQNTRDFMNMLQQMLLISETMTEYSSIPMNAGFSKAIRGGVLYLVKNYKNINYFVAAKKNFPVA